MTGLQWWEAWVRQEKVGVVIVNIDPGGGRSKGVGNFLQIGVAGSFTVRGGYVGA